MAKDAIPIVPTHPGKLLKKHLAGLKRPKTQIARLLRLSRQSLHAIQTGKQSITPTVALRVAKLTGTSAEMWLNLQQAHDLARARSECRELLLQIPALEGRW